MSTSEVARIRAQIEQEYQSAYNGLHGLAQVGMVPHQHRTECTERISDLHVDLIALVGVEQAGKIVSDVLEPLEKGGGKTPTSPAAFL